MRLQKNRTSGRKELFVIYDEATFTRRDDFKYSLIKLIPFGREKYPWGATNKKLVRENCFNVKTILATIVSATKTKR
jgi:hypothetical protein